MQRSLEIHGRTERGRTLRRRTSLNVNFVVRNAEVAIDQEVVEQANAHILVGVETFEEQKAIQCEIASKDMMRWPIGTFKLTLRSRWRNPGRWAGRWTWPSWTRQQQLQWQRGGPFWS